MNPSTHHPLSPSKWPAWAKCPCFDSKPAGRAAEAGIRAHAFLAWLLNDCQGPAPHALPDEINAATWAAGQVLGFYGEYTEPMMIEQRVEIQDSHDSLIGIFGTPDVALLDHKDELCVIDFKFCGDGSKNYTPQLAGYAIAIASSRCPKDSPPYWITDHVKLITLNGLSRTVSVVKTRILNVLSDAVRIVQARQNPDRQPSACEWCEWCAEYRVNGCRLTVDGEGTPV